MSGIHINFSINQKYYKELKKMYSNLPDTLEDAYFDSNDVYVSSIEDFIRFLDSKDDTPW